MAQPLTQNFPDHSKAVLEQLNNQRFCGAFCDILLQVEDYDFKLHKCLLAALSAKLQTMLFNMRPECGSILTLRDISVTGFRYIIEYLYTGTLHLNTLHVHEVLSAAQYLEIREIEKACYDFLKSTVSTSSHAHAAAAAAAAAGSLTGSGLPDPTGRYSGYHVSSPYMAQGSYQAQQPNNVPSSILNYNYKEDYMKLIESLQVDPTPSDQQTEMDTNSSGTTIPVAPTTTAASVTNNFHQMSAPSPASTTSSVVAGAATTTQDHRGDRETVQLNDGEVMRTILSIFSQETFPSRDNKEQHVLDAGSSSSSSAAASTVYMANVKPHISAMLTPVGEKNSVLLKQGSSSSSPVMTVPAGQVHQVMPARMETVRRDLTQAMQSVCDAPHSAGNRDNNIQGTVVVDLESKVLQSVGGSLPPGGGGGGVPSSGPLPSITSIQKLPSHLSSLQSHMSIPSSLHVQSPRPPPHPPSTLTMPSQPSRPPVSSLSSMPPGGQVVDDNEQEKELMAVYTTDTEDSDGASNHAVTEDEEDDEEEDDNNGGFNNNSSVLQRPLTIHLDNDIANNAVMAVPPRGESSAGEQDSDDNVDGEKPRRKRNRPMHIKKRIKLEAEAQRQKELKQASQDDNGRRKAAAAVALASLSQPTKPAVKAAGRGKGSRSQRGAGRAVKAGGSGSNSSSSNSKRYQKKFMTCEKCGRKFFNKEQFVKHMDLHNREMLYSCHVCGLKYARREDFTRHMRTHSNETFLCSFCNEIYTDAKKYKTHMKSEHHDRKPFRCQHPGCAFRSDRPSYVEEHAVIHSDIKTHTCEKCGKQFSQRNGLRIHKQSCYEQRSYLCDICGAKFNQLQSMKSHRRLHTGEKPHICLDCGKAFTDHTNYKRHRRIHDNSFPYQCPYCEKRYRHSNSLKAHVKSHKVVIPEGTPVNSLAAPKKEQWDNVASTGLHNTASASCS